MRAMRYYPLFVRLDGRACVVIGGGEVAERKVRGLLRAGARVTLVSPAATPALEEFAAAGDIGIHRRRYRRGDLQGAFLAYAATDDEAVNGEIAGEAEREGVLLNVVDRPAFCSFTVPAVVERGDLVIATSTGGASPMMARRIREELERQFGPEYARALEILRGVRERLGREGRDSDERKRIFAALVDSPLLDLVRAEDSGGIDRLLAETLGSGYTVGGLGAP
jgi:precorrin-2 dehydrogenase/sirohydrochlorin ferrochelatase